MSFNIVGSRLSKTAFTATIFFLASGASFAQQQVNLTAGPTTATLPDGFAVPMWGYSCGPAVSGSSATCAKLNPNTTGWSPVVLTVPTGQGLTINLTNNLSFTPTGSTTANAIPTSLVIVGQLRGGLGTPTYQSSPTHAPQGTTWPIAGDTTGPTFNPPAQDRKSVFSCAGTPRSSSVAIVMRTKWSHSSSVMPMPAWDDFMSNPEY